MLILSGVPRPVLDVLIMLVLFVANGVFAASELSLVSARHHRREALANAGNRRAALALALAENPGNLLSTVQVGITLISTVAAAFGGSTFVPYVEPVLKPWLGRTAPAVAFVLVVAIITYVSLVIGELTPKRLALRNPETLALAVAPFMNRLSRVARAVVWLLNVSTQGMLRLLGASASTAEQVTEEDVKALVDEAAEGGELEARETRLIHSAMKLTDRSARELMTPRVDIVLLDTSKGVPELLADALAGGHARYPAHDGDPEHVLGLLTSRALLKLSLAPDTPVNTLLRPLVFVPDTASSSSVLEAFRARRTRMALVV
ncbi:MAG TPA: hemolysin family protein, partial [Deinococcales bacterium]|nr:hemolysin family protein [Deinococcales bacterium]